MRKFSRLGLVSLIITSVVIYVVLCVIRPVDEWGLAPSNSESSFELFPKHIVPDFKITAKPELDKFVKACEVSNFEHNKTEGKLCDCLPLTLGKYMFAYQDLLCTINRTIIVHIVIIISHLYIHV